MICYSYHKTCYSFADAGRKRYPSATLMDMDGITGNFLTRSCDRGGQKKEREEKKQREREMERERGMERVIEMDREREMERERDLVREREMERDRDMEMEIRRE